MVYTKSEILTFQKLSKNFYLLKFKWSSENDTPLPGQFFTIRVSDTTVPLLRRPFAFSNFDITGNTASFIFEKKGVGTEMLAAMGVNEELDIIGPLGNTFFQPQDDRPIILVAGGIGLGPMLFLAETLQRGNKVFNFVFGAKSKTLIPNQNIFKNINPVICTDDGSDGFSGTTIDYLKSINDDGILNSGHLMACGPLPMLKACHEFALENSTSCQVSLEQTMACGVGACMGCVVKIKQEPGFARVCKEGTVFNSKDILWT